MEKMVSLQIPESTYRKLERAAAVTYRSIDDIVASAIETSLPTPEGIPSEIADKLSAMHLLSDEALWAASKPSISPAEQTRLQQLNHLAGERPLDQAEQDEQANLLYKYHLSVLGRAQALAILSQRGHQVSP